ncbi:MAG: hypothetical protein MZV64_30150 [Ignavibacteriales bacterium]|nr:hypothetical protein [Ignavibacteriales bacterium]
MAAGTYDRLEFEIHKPEDDGDADDAAFLAAHPDFRRISIRVTGTYNGTPFAYTTDLSEEQERALVPPLSLSTATRHGPDALRGRRYLVPHVRRHPARPGIGQRGRARTRASSRTTSRTRSTPSRTTIATVTTMATAATMTTARPTVAPATTE